MHTLNDLLVFNWNWESAVPGETDTDLIRCLASWRWVVRDRVLTRHHVHHDDAARDELFVSLLPFTEFVLANWWALLHEQSVRPSSIERLDLQRRHVIDAHSDGFAYPAVSLFGAGSHIRVTAQQKSIQSAELCFTTTTEARDRWTGVPRTILEQRLLELANDTLQRLGKCPITSDLREWLAAIEHSRMDSDETRFCTAAGLLGEDPYAMEPSVQQAIFDTVEQFGEAFAFELFTVLDASTLATGRKAFSDAESQLAQGSQELAAAITHARREYVSSMANPQKSPWQRGYALASAIRERIGIEQGFSDFSSLSNAVLHLDWVPEVRKSLPLAAQGVGYCDKKKATVLLAPPRHRNRLFVWAQMLGDILLSGAQTRFIAIKNASDRQKAARAFAAELLLPAAVLKTTDWRSTKQRQALIEHYGVSNAIARYQYQNQVANTGNMA